MHRCEPNRRRGFSLVELMAATAMLAALSATTVVLLRSSQHAWSFHRDDFQTRQSALATLRHVARTVRQSRRVNSISAAADDSGRLTVLGSTGVPLAYDHDSGNQKVLYGSPTATSLLANSIKTVNFIGLTSDGSTTTTNPEEIHAVRCTVAYDLNRPSGPVTETLSCTAWLRSW